MPLAKILTTPIRWRVVFAVVSIVLALLSSPAVYWQIRRAQGRAFCQRINALLPSDVRFRDVRASQSMKGPFLFGLDGRVETQSDFDALVTFVEANDPPHPYNPNGAFVLPSAH